MSVILGKETIDVSNIKNVTLRQVTQEELEKFEKNKNGLELYQYIIFDLTFIDKLEKILNEYRLDVGSRLSVPKLEKKDLPGDAYDDDIKEWEFSQYGKHFFSFSNYDEKGDLYIEWNFEIFKKVDCYKRGKTSRKVKVSVIMSVLNELTNKSKKRVKKENKPIGLFENISREWLEHTYEEIQTDLLPIYTEYKEGIRKIEIRKREKLIFINEHKNDYLLCVELNDFTQRMYMESVSGFDIFAKEKELTKILLDRI